MPLYSSVVALLPDFIGVARHHTAYVDGVGAVCDYSLLEGNASQTGSMAGPQRKDGGGGPGGGAGGGEGGHDMGVHSSRHLHRNYDVDGPNDAKLERSMLAFQQNYPNVLPSVAAQPLRQRLDAYKNMK